MYQIVTINVSETISATPNNLQQKASVLSFGSLMAQIGQPRLVLEEGEINDVVRNPISTYTSQLVNESGGESGGEAGGESGGSGSESGGGSTKVSRRAAAAEKRVEGAPRAEKEVMFTITAGEGRKFSQAVGSNVSFTVKGCYPDKWNGTFTAQITADNTLQWTMKTADFEGEDPAEVGYFMLSEADLVQTAMESFFAQGQQVGIYALDLGTQSSADDEVSAFKDYLQDPTERMYTYLVPFDWYNLDSFLQLAKNYTANDRLTYFLIPAPAPTTTSSNVSNPFKGLKCVVAVSDSTYPNTNDAAAFMYLIVSADPSPVNKVAPFAFRYVQGATAVDYKDSWTAALRAENINYIQTGAEGGISNNIFALGVASDGRDFLYWYCVDWTQINVHLALANAVINGSNNPINPLYYDQDGIDRLQQVAQSTFNSGVSYGLINGTPAVTAMTFREYVRLNPKDYAQGRYAGLKCEYTPQRGFIRIVFNINVNFNPSQTAAGA